MPKFKVKKDNSVTHGTKGKDGGVVEKVYVAGDVIELDAEAAAKMEHALEPLEWATDKSDKPVVK